MGEAVVERLVEFPCTARELEAALHRTCDHGLWDSMVEPRYEHTGTRNVYLLAGLGLVRKEEEGEDGDR